MKPKTSLLLILISLASCDPSRVYEKNIDFDEPVWVVSEQPQFQFEITDADIPYNLKVNIRSAIGYPYQNIYLKYYLKDSLGNELQSDLKEFYLFDEKTGEPQGDGMGDLFDNQFSLIDNYKFPTSGKYSAELQQFMRMDSLPMVLSVGLRVEMVDE